MKSEKIFFLSFLLCLILLTSCNSTLKATKPYDDITDLTEVVKISSGKIQGIYNPDKTVSLYAGIPFAAPPVGDLRWREPQNVKSWNDILVCDTFKPEAMQKKNSKIFTWAYNKYINSKGSRTDNAPMSEDCLYLNVWTPANSEEKSLPVLVYIHGGSLMSGQSWFESYDGEYLASQGIIVVTVAYRLGVFGYFALPELEKESRHNTTGNYGLLDQIKALEWVNNNIEAFGGDVNNITIAGESAGSSSVNALCASPLTKGMFRRAIAESSGIMHEYPSHTFRTKDAAFRMGRNIMKEFNCISIDEMRKIPAENLIKTKYQNNSMTVDGYALPKTPYEIYSAGENHEEALLNGFNANEGAAFTFFQNINKFNYEKLLSQSPYITNLDAILALKSVNSDSEARAFYNDIFSVICFAHPHEEWSKTVTAQGKPVYEYFFTKENNSISTMHSGEIIYFYGNVPHDKNYIDSDYKLENITSSYVLNFVKYGNPNGKAIDGSDLPEWKTFAESNGQLIELGENIHMREDPFKKYYQYIK